MLNLAHFLDVAAKDYPDVTAVILDQYRLSYAELAAYARRVANILIAKGIRRGDRVAMLIPNTPHFPMIYFGILHAGGTVVPINVLFKHHEIQQYLEDSEAVLLFAFKMFEDEAIKAFNQVETCHQLIVVSTPDDFGDPPVGDNFMKLLLQASPEFDTVQTMPDDTAVVLYTSGTTGTPKGAELTHFNMFFNAYYASRHMIRANPGDIGVIVLPLFHSFAQSTLMNAAVLGAATMTLMVRFETDKLLEVLARDRVQILVMVPTMFYYLLNAQDWQKYDCSALQIALSGGASLPEDVHRRFLERYGITIHEGYGLSETSPVASFMPFTEPVRVGSIGKPIWGTEMRIKGPDGRFSAVDEVGEIVIRGHNIMKGYLNRPEATRESIVDGWFHTGDLGRMDKDGYFYIVDRKKDLIIRGGMNIYPRELEELLYGHPKVLEAAVIGIPDEARGEEVKICVAPRSGETLAPQEIFSYVQERVARFKWPKEVAVLPELPKGPTGKILKRELK